MEEFKLSPHTEYEARMRKLGKRLARKLNVNYFDYIDESVMTFYGLSAMFSLKYI